jgi:hypothetical protein
VYQITSWKNEIYLIFFGGRGLLYKEYMLSKCRDFQMLPKKSKLRYQKELEKTDSERKTMSESEANERETFTHW